MNIFILFFLLFISYHGFTQINLPFRICDNRILVEYVLFDKLMIMGFDTGSTMNVLQMNSLPQNLELDERRFINLGFYGAELYDIITTHNTIFGSDWTAVKANSFDDGCQIDGILSGNIVREKILEIDFKNGYLNFFDPSEYIPNQTATVLSIKPAWVDYETSLSFTLKNSSSVSGSVIFKDSLLYNTQFLIDTGSKHEIFLLVNDSLLIKKIISGEKEYINHFFGLKIMKGFTNVDYSIENTDIEGNTDVFVFYETPSPLSSFGKREIGVLLGIPFFRRFEKVTIDIINKKLYLLNPLQE